MKAFCYLILISFAIASCLSKPKADTQRSANSINRKYHIHRDSLVTVKDTFFLQRVLDSGRTIEEVYIEPDRNTPNRKWIWDMERQDTLNIKQYLSLLAKDKRKLLHVNLNGFPSLWRPVYQFKNRYYVYNPSSEGYQGTMIITDSLVIRYSGFDGYYPIAIASFIKHTDGSVTIKCKYAEQSEGIFLEDVNIYPVDDKTGLSVWVLNDSHYGRDTLLMVSKQGESNYNAITAASFGQRGGEYNFSEIDFKKLLSKYH